MKVEILLYSMKIVFLRQRLNINSQKNLKGNAADQVL